MANESVIKLFEGQKIRVVWNEEQEKYYFAVQDIVQILTDSVDVKQYVKRLRSRDSELDSVWGTICTPPPICIHRWEKASIMIDYFMSNDALLQYVGKQMQQMSICGDKR
jgi:hypothetical protein